MGLFRLVELSGGSIQIDGIDIAKCGLQEFRSRLSIIPQEPVMFKGTIRSNLDPFEVYEDSKIWDALAMAGLKESVQESPDKLETVVEENGSNFSLGQRQLYCLTRAILKDSSILVMDEATSSLDLDTDSFIQKTIRKAFAKRTVITIAHRLDTIIDSDKILVMGAGKVLEFDTVPNLLSNPKGEFYSLVDEAGLDVQAIIRIAKEAEEKKMNGLIEKKKVKDARKQKRAGASSSAGPSSEKRSSKKTSGEK
jgi:ABC-type multidrug transport system fused ATPase/permease subunit